MVFFAGGDLEMNAQQKADFLSFIHQEGKGFIGVHSAAITFVDWPEFVEMVGGTYHEHPWTPFDAPILVEDPGFPGMQQFPHSFTLRDEIYQMKDYSRDKVRVLMRLNVSKLDMKNKNVDRADGDFAVTWAKMYGKGASTTRDSGTWKGTGTNRSSKNDYRGHQMGDRVGKCRTDIPSAARKLAWRKSKTARVD